MRQGQQNRRGRGRNRKGQNPLTRSYESNGPEVKIRGTPAHVAEKYMSLARDAMASGDRVLAENFYQHAEHYNRIIMAYRDQQIGQSNENASGRGRGAGQDDNSDQGDGADQDNETLNGEAAAVPGGEPQPSAQGFEEQPQAEADNGSERRSGGRGARNNGPRRGRGNGARGGGRQSSGSSRAAKSDNDDASESSSASERFADSDDKPDFLSRPVPVRRPRRSSRTEDAPAEAAPQAASTDES